MKVSKSLLLVLLIIICAQTEAQMIIKSSDEYSPQVGNLISMMDDLKSRITTRIGDLSDEQTDFLLDESANSIGALVLHLAATEKLYQVLTFEDREFNDQEQAEWGAAMSLGDAGRKELIGKPMSYYLDRWTDVRNETKRLLKGQSDDWLNEEREFDGQAYNYHWFWYHVMEHQSNHMGQMVFIKSRLP